MSVENNLMVMRENSNIACMLNEIMECGPSVIMGGAIRDWQLGKTPHDIDIVVDCPTERLEILSKYKPLKNKFGGYKLTLNKTEFDIWNLDSTWAINNNSKFEKQISTLPETVFLNIDAIMYYMRTGELVDKGFAQAMKSRMLDIVYEPNPYPYFCVSKSLVTMQKYDLQPSQRLKQFIRDQEGRGYSERNFIVYQNVYYGSKVYDFKECMSRVGL